MHIYFVLYYKIVAQGGNHSGISKTLRLPENIVEKVQTLANLKNLSFNRTIISLLEFSLENLDDTDKEILNNTLN